MKLFQNDLDKSEKLAAKLAGRPAAEKGLRPRIEAFQDKLIELNTKLQEARVVFDQAACFNLVGEISTTKAALGGVFTDFEKPFLAAERELETLTRPVIVEHQETLRREIKRLQAKMDFTPTERRYDSTADRKMFSVKTNEQHIQTAIRGLVKCSAHLQEMIHSSLKEIETVFEEAMTNIPEIFPLSETAEMGSDGLRDLTERKSEATKIDNFQPGFLYQ